MSDIVEVGLVPGLVVAYVVDGSVDSETFLTNITEINDDDLGFLQGIFCCCCLYCWR